MGKSTDPMTFVLLSRIGVAKYNARGHKDYRPIHAEEHLRVDKRKCLAMTCPAEQE